MSLITTVEHALATAASDIVKAGKYIEQMVLPILKKAETEEATIEGVTALIAPAAVNIERMAFAGLGVIVKAIMDGTTAAASGGVNVQLDAAFVADIKSVIPAIKAAAIPLLPAVANPPAKTS